MINYLKAGRGNARLYNEALERILTELEEKAQHYEYEGNEERAGDFRKAVKIINDALYSVGIAAAARSINKAYEREDYDAYEERIANWAKALEVSGSMVEDAATDFRLYGEDRG